MVEYIHEREYIEISLKIESERDSGGVVKTN